MKKSVGCCTLFVHVFEPRPPLRSGRLESFVKRSFMTTGDPMNIKITMLGRTMRYAAIYLFVHVLVMSPGVSQYPVNAQTLKPDKQSLDMIADFAERICSEVPLEGSSSNLDLSGSAESKLNGLLKNLGTWY